MSKSPKLLKIKMRQVAALPYRQAADGSFEVVLVTTRESGRWILPKGWPIKGLRNCNAAETEALEEAGLVGTAERKAFGHFVYVKRFPTRSDRVAVEVFPLRVERQLDEFREKGQRSVSFFPPEEAARIVSDDGVGPLILEFVARRSKAAGVAAAASPTAEASPDSDGAALG